MKTIILVPSRGRPQNLERMIKSARDLAGGSLWIMAAVDADDEQHGEYMKLINLYPNFSILSGPRDTLSGWTNTLAKEALVKFGSQNTYFVSMGDDHVVKSSSWDVKLMNGIRKLRTPGFSYGDDKINGSGLCTSWMASAIIVEKLGWMMLPSCRHMYVDNAIMELGTSANCISYVQSVTIEHLHPIIRAAKIDQTYIDGSSHIDHDLKAFRDWRYSIKFERNLQTIKDLTCPWYET